MKILILLNRFFFCFCCCLFVLQQNLAAVLEKEERNGLVNGKEDMVQVPTISSANAGVLKGLVMVLGFLYRDNCRSATNLKIQLDWDPVSRQFLGSNMTKIMELKLLFCVSVGLLKTTRWLCRRPMPGRTRSPLMSPTRGAFLLCLTADNAKVPEWRPKCWHSASGASTPLWWEVRRGGPCHVGHTDPIAHHLYSDQNQVPAQSRAGLCCPSCFILYL